MTSSKLWTHGSALAGPLQDLIGPDVTVAVGRCGNCGRTGPMGEVRVFRTTGIGGECSTEVRRKSGTEMCEMVSESADGVGMHYEVDVAREAGGGSVDGLLRMMRRASATESGYMGGLFQVSAVALGPQLGRGPAET